MQEIIRSLVNAQQLYQIGDKVWSHIGSRHLTTGIVSAAMRRELQHYVCVTVGRHGYAILLGLNDNLARELATNMFDCEKETLRAGDIEDALGELANMLAGKIGLLIGEAGGLGLPEHLNANTLPSRLRQEHIDVEICALSDEAPVYVALLKITKR